MGIDIAGYSYITCGRVLQRPILHNRPLKV